VKREGGQDGEMEDISALHLSVSTLVRDDRWGMWAHVGASLEVNV
jgi:hypothetical protein